MWRQRDNEEMSTVLMTMAETEQLQDRNGRRHVVYVSCEQAMGVSWTKDMIHNMTSLCGLARFSPKSGVAKADIILLDITDTSRTQDETFIASFRAKVAITKRGTPS
ncbi:hypothetical protein BaRGS_00027330 [Batillaria attramentaria]|uniref:Uncharacterized protein n=1 Tax=Batillaria attramentaria TaxID=370345 RepID=A0ABD0K2D0_9CAEN